MIKLNILQVLCVANFLSFGLQLQPEEDEAPLKLQYRPQSGNLKQCANIKSLEVFPNDLVYRYASLI